MVFQMKKTVVLSLAIIMCLFAVTGSIAYFTDSITAQGQIESGNLDVEQYEFERIKDENGSYTTALKEYTQNQVLYPCLLPDDLTADSHRTGSIEFSYSADDNAAIPALNFTASLRDESIRGFVDKIVVVKNEGSLNNYVRTFVAVPTAFDQAVVLDWNTADWTLGSTAFEDVLTVEKYQITDVPYTIYYATCNTALIPGGKAQTSLLGYYLKPEVGHSSLGYTLKTDDGTTVTLGTATELKILVATEASQVIPTGIEHQAHDTPEAAMTKTYGEPSAERHPWRPKTDAPANGTTGN